MRKKLQFLIFILFLSSFLSCTKEFDKVEVNILLDEYFGVHARIPVPIRYTVSGAKIDSIGLIVDGKIQTIQKHIKDSIIFVGVANTRPIVKIAVYHHSGLITYSENRKIDVYHYDRPKINIKITNSQGDEGYFLGERLLFKFISNTYNFHVNECQQMTLIVNGHDLGTITTPPFEFTSHIITTKENHIKLDIIDKLGISHAYEETIEVPVNPPTEFQFKFYSSSCNDLNLSCNSCIVS